MVDCFTLWTHVMQSVTAPRLIDDWQSMQSITENDLGHSTGIRRIPVDRQKRRRGYISTIVRILGLGADAKM